MSSHNRVAIVTGAGSGIGKQAALALATRTTERARRAGASIAGLYRFAA